MKISSLIFHFEEAPVFTARQYGTTRWIEVTEREPGHNRFCIVLSDDRPFEELERVAVAMTAAWSAGAPSDAVERMG